MQFIGENYLIVWLVFAIAAIGGLWFLLKYIIYQIAYTIGKGLKDARGE